jgi:fructose-specific phosphotransferase system IIA component
MEKIITKELISLDIELEDKTAAIKEIAELVAASSRLTDRDKYIRDVWEREEMVPTGIGDLIAIPHARSAAVIVSSLVYIRLTSPIQWNEEEQAKYIFGIAVPSDNADNLHLKILASVAKKLLDDKIKKIIVESNSKEEILEALLA